MIHPERKHPRLKEYNYSQPGYYYVTIHASENCPPLGAIRKAGDGAENSLTDLGEIVAQELLALEGRFPVQVDSYVIMPNHIHCILHIWRESDATLMDMVCAFKSLATRRGNAHLGIKGQRLFQNSFYENVLRSQQAYLETRRYIEENPLKWLLKPEDLA